MCNQGCAKWGPIRSSMAYTHWVWRGGPSIKQKKGKKKGNLVKADSEITLQGLRSLIKFVSGSIFEIK